MDVDLVLAPVDGSDQSERAIEYAITVADAYDADVHLLFVLDERLVKAIDEGAVDADTVAEDHREFTEMVRGRLDSDGVGGNLDTSTAAGFSPTSLRQSPGSVILDVAEAIEADFLVVPREPGSNETDEAIGRAALYVIEYASQPVLSV
ncbi:Nucleotide-binding universal stress protein, UspA family [Halomicrobium zhouii]|uniref:Nucleotide-binding universal stress protein, UspA family n=1 Tax=Halomicrobium zhouii TaxID=767519 RepID=A0A1I6MBD4_9EURY|nr:universal stress protein [Halomicrobium zhouii]SFS13039.1 Nucleotide-binding universal stress protein, UspA family [Halomicrobium zhouii]